LPAADLVGQVSHPCTNVQQATVISIVTWAEPFRGSLRAGLIPDITVTVIPILLGSGIRLFGELHADTGLRLLSLKAFPFGFVQSHYAVLNHA